MHTLTSSIFLPAYMTPLSIPQRRTILRTYLLIVLLTAIARGRPQIDFEYLMSANPYPVGPNTGPEKWNKDHVISNPTEGEARNPWLSIVESSLYHHGKILSPLNGLELIIRFPCPEINQVLGPLRLLIRFPPPRRIYRFHRREREGSTSRNRKSRRNRVQKRSGAVDGCIGMV